MRPQCFLALCFHYLGINIEHKGGQQRSKSEPGHLPYVHFLLYCIRFINFFSVSEYVLNYDTYLLKHKLPEDVQLLLWMCIN